MLFFNPFLGRDGTTFSITGGIYLKKICLIVECYKKNIISVAILLVVLIFALLQSVSFLGRVKYMTYTRDFLKEILVLELHLRKSNTAIFLVLSR